ncbi:MAG: geranylgeranyl reductase family protein [bacterium]
MDYVSSTLTHNTIIYMRYDVAIIGAGPAGSFAGYHLAKNGFKVVILDKEKFPRFKPCGGGLSLKAWELLDFNIEHLIERKIKTAKIFYKSPDFIELKADKYIGCIIDRKNFDFFLVQKAIEKGAEFRDESKVTSMEIGEKEVSIVAGGGKIVSRFVIGADGASSWTAKFLGLNYPEKVVSVATDIEMDETNSIRYEESLAFDFGFVPWGYAWIFPGKDKFSVGIYTLKKMNISGLLEKFIEKQGLSGKRIFMHRGGIIPLGGLRQNIAKGRVLLAGDAAGLVDPFLGEGIYYALKSGQLAAESIMDFSSKNISLNNYAEKVYTDMVIPFQFARKLSYFVFKFNRIGYHILKNSRFFQKYIIDIISGERIY